MALWGKRDSFAITGVASTTNGSITVSGNATTTFLTEIDKYDSVFINGTHVKVDTIVSANTFTLSNAWASANVANGVITGQDSPKYVPAYDTSLIFGVDQNEALAALGASSPGWVRRLTYTDMHGNARAKKEILVAFSRITGDASDDTSYPDVSITIVGQPLNFTANTGTAGSFTVGVSVQPVGTAITYQWQKAANTYSNAVFVDLTDTGTYSNSATATLVVANNAVAGNTTMYRVRLAGTGIAANVISTNAVLTITP